MTLAFIVYLIYTVTSIKIFLNALIAISGLTLLTCAFIRAVQEDYSWSFKDRNCTILKDDVLAFRRYVKTTIKYSFITCVAASVLFVLIPSEKTAWLMVGAYAGQKVAENENVQRLSGKVLVVIEQNIDKYIKENIDKQVSPNGK